ncbi:glycosyltransferase [Sessilibacter sp. MAH2]
MIFVTSGSMLPFDRLFKTIDKAVADGIITDTVFGQIGEGKYTPQHFKYERFVDKNDFDRYVLEANLVIGHAGIGVITQALDSKTPLLVMARLSEFGEHVNDHQVSTANKFEELGHVLSFDENNLTEKLQKVTSFIPKPRNPNVDGVGDRVAQFLGSL